MTTARAVTASPLPWDAVTTPNPLRGQERTWTETNCYVDLWLEVLHALGHDPRSSGAMALSADFDGDQWTFLKQPAEDLSLLYGIEVAELNLWRPLEDHVVDHLAAGRLLTVEVDAYWLPDTAGLSYHEQHTKTTVVIHSVDRVAPAVGYFHGAGRFTAHGLDAEGLLRRHPSTAELPPYVEVVRLQRQHPDPEQVRRTALGLVRHHLDRRPKDNPVARMGDAIVAAAPWLAEQPMQTFHAYAFATCRQCGGTAQLAADLCDWLGDLALEGVAARFRSVAAAAKSLQFSLARAVRGRRVDLRALLDPMATDWAAGMSGVVEVVAARGD